MRADPEVGKIEVDLRDNPDTLASGLNVTEANAKAAAMIGVFSGLAVEVPRNAGSYRRVAVLVRENCCIGGPRHPASCSLSTTNLATKVGNATQTALAELGDGFGLAETGTIVPASMAVISGRDPRRHDAPFINSLFLMHTGGAGAPQADAWLTTVHIGDLGLCYLDSIETDELLYPLRVGQRRLLIDTEGAGRFRGAPAALAEYGPVGTTMTAWFASDGTENAPAGVRGGLAGGRAAQFRRAADGTLAPVSAFGGVTLAPGETLVAVCCGGGGYGPPWQRDPDRGPPRRPRRLGLAGAGGADLRPGPRCPGRDRPPGYRHRPRPSGRGGRQPSACRRASRIRLKVVAAARRRSRKRTAGAGRRMELADQGAGILPVCDLGRRSLGCRYIPDRSELSIRIEMRSEH